jgi:ABC-type glutathione transport system ATPase component
MGQADIMTGTAEAATEADSPKPQPQAAADMPLLRIDAVVKKFSGVRAVDRLSLDIRAGEFFGLLGPSGCGCWPVSRRRTKAAFCLTARTSHGSRRISARST